jgi:hypothetical protein
MMRIIIKMKGGSKNGKREQGRDWCVWLSFIDHLYHADLLTVPCNFSGFSEMRGIIYCMKVR